MPDMEMTIVLSITWPDGSVTTSSIDIDWVMGIIVTMKALKEQNKIKAFTISG